MTSEPTPVWHPPRAVLEIFELVLDGALPPVPDVLALLDTTDCADLARRADPAHAAPLPDVRPLVVEDAEGTPVARLEAGDVLIADRPFTAPPLRAHRRPPEKVGARVGVLAVAVAGLPRPGDLAGVADLAGDGRAVRWLVLVGAGRGPLPPEAAWRAVRGLVREGDDVVPVAVPLLIGPTGDDVLAAEVAGRYAGRGGTWHVLPGGSLGDAEPWPAPVLRELDRAVPPPVRRGVTVFFTGLSGSGKSTLAKALAARLLEDGRRTVTLLDGDEVRRLLSHGLGFSRADRDLNIRRIGFVAAEVTRHGGVAICAPIAPYAAVRADVRAAVEQVGDLVLVHVATPLEECERRDRKGLYARARRGEIPDFTGISSPYETPVDAELVVDTTGRAIDDCLDDVWALLERRGYLG